MCRRSVEFLLIGISINHGGKTMDKILKYSIQLAMLKQLLDKGLITEIEHRKIKNQLMRDYNVVSDLCT